MRNFSAKNLLSIGESAFSGCESLSCITTEKVNFCETYCFAGCKSLVELKLLSLKEIPEKIFSSCTALK